MRFQDEENSTPLQAPIWLQNLSVLGGLTLNNWLGNGLETDGKLVSNPEQTLRRHVQKLASALLV